MISRSTGLGGLCDDHGRGDQRTLIGLQQRPAGRVVPVGAIGRRNQRAGIYDQHLIAPEPLCQHLIGICRAASGSRNARGGKGQPTARQPGQLRRQENRCQLVCSLAATGCLSGQCFRDGVIQMERDCHNSSVTAHVRGPG